MIKCKGCSGEIEHVPLAQVADGSKSHAGPALIHVPASPCQWFLNAPASEILAYINVAEYKTKRDPPLPGLATK